MGTTGSVEVRETLLENTDAESIGVAAVWAEPGTRPHTTAGCIMTHTLYTLLGSVHFLFFQNNFQDRPACDKFSFFFPGTLPTTRML
jgi:hypothetical protein